MADPLYWLSNLFETWVPTSGYGYYIEEAALAAATSYFTSGVYSGYSDISFIPSLEADPYTGWTYVTGDDNGLKYYKLISGTVNTGETYSSLGYLFKYVYYPSTITAENYSIDVVTTINNGDIANISDPTL